jgi:hypothetical protein
VDVVYASADQRDRFLNAIDAKDIDLCQILAVDLMNCGNALPGITCEQLGLPRGSTYGSGARAVLSMQKVSVAAQSLGTT